MAYGPCSTIADEYAAYCLDGAVVLFGSIVESKLLETYETGSGASKKRRRKWQLKEILADGFTFPRERDDGMGGGAVADGEFYDEVYDEVR